MNIKCPYCGTAYVVEKKDIGRFVTCESCGKGFVAGVAPGTKAGVAPGARPSDGAPVPQTVVRQPQVTVALWICVAALVLNFVALVVLSLRVRSDFSEMRADVAHVRKSVDEMNGR